MSQLQVIAGRLRSLAQQADPVSEDVEAAARRLQAIATRVAALRRSGVDTSALDGAVQQAIARADSAVQAVKQVKSDGTRWADELASGVRSATGGADSGGPKSKPIRPKQGKTAAEGLSRSAAGVFGDRLAETLGATARSVEKNVEHFAIPLLKAAATSENLAIWAPTVAGEVAGAIADSQGLDGGLVSETASTVTEGLIELAEPANYTIRNIARLLSGRLRKDR